MLKFSTEVRKCVSARVLKEIRNLMLTESDSPAFRNCDARTEKLAPGLFEILFHCTSYSLKTTGLFTHPFCYNHALVLINLVVVT